jgi:hypothetical protein
MQLPTGLSGTLLLTDDLEPMGPSLEGLSEFGSFQRKKSM